MRASFFLHSVFHFRAEISLFDRIYVIKIGVQTYYFCLPEAWLLLLEVIEMKKTILLTLLCTITISLIAVSTVLGQVTSVDASFSAVPSKVFPQGTSIQTIVQPDGKVIVFGPRMVAGGVARGDIIRLNVDGSVDTSFNYCGCGISYINNVMLAPDGKILVGGSDPGFGRIIRLNSNGSIDASFSVSRTAPQPVIGGTDFIVSAVQLDGKVFATNRYSSQGWVSYSLIRYNSDGTGDTGMAPIGIAAGSPVFAYIRISLLSDGRFYLASTAGNTGSSASLTRRLANGTVDPTWETPSFATSGFPTRTSIGGISVSTDGSIFVAGTWDSVNGLDRKFLVKLLPAGNVDMSFNGPAVLNGGQVEVLPDGKVLYSANVDISGINKLFRLNADGSSDGTYTQDPAVVSLLSSWGIDSLQRTTFYASTTTGNRIVRLNSNGGLDSGFAPVLDTYGTVNAIARQPDGKVLVAGVYTSMNGVVRSNFSRVNADGSLDMTFDAGSGFSSPPSQLLLQTDGRVIAVGEFTSYNGSSVTGIVRINTDGSRDSTFNVTTSQTPRVVAIRIDGRIIIGGGFTTVNGTARTGVARLNTDGSLDSTFNPIFGGGASIYSLAILSDGNIMVGGAFSGVNGFNRSNFVRLTSDGSLDQTFTATGVSSVTKLIVQPDGKYLIGTFSPTGAISRRNIDGTDDSTFSAPSITSSSSSDLNIEAMLQLSDGSILIGGVFNTVANISRSYLTRLAPNGTLDRLFPSPSANARVRSMVSDSTGKVIIGGDFSTILGSTRAGIARLDIGPLRSATPFDFNGDGRADFSIFRPSTNQWYELFYGGSTFSAPVFGTAGDIPVPADFDGDGTTDEAIFRPSTGTWWYQSSLDSSQKAQPWGTSGDIPLSGDFDGDGRADYILFRPSNSTWYRLSTSLSQSTTTFGQAGDKPQVGDFDGDGKTDLAIFRPSDGNWWYAASGSGGQHRATRWGLSGDIPAPADYDGDKKTDHAVFRPSTGVWYVLNSTTGTSTILPFGSNGDRPISADYDGDGRADIAVFRPSTGIWYLLQSTSGFTGAQWGVSTDVAIPSAFAQF